MMLTRKEWLLEQVSTLIFKQSYLLWCAERLAVSRTPRSTIDSLVAKLKYCSEHIDDIDSFRYPVFITMYSDTLDGVCKAADICSLEIANRKISRSVLPKERKEVMFDTFIGELNIAPLVSALISLSVSLKAERGDDWVSAKGNRIIARVVSDVNDLLDAIMGSIVDRG